MSTAKSVVGKAIYPIYFDAARTLNKGRRVPLNMCIQKPTWKHLVMVCNTLNIPYDLDKDKSHPKDLFNKGRLRIQVYAEKHRPGITRTPTDERFKNSHELLLLIGKTLPTIVDKVKPENGNKEGNKAPSVTSPTLNAVSEAPGVTLVPRIKKKTKKK